MFEHFLLLRQNAINAILGSILLNSTLSFDQDINKVIGIICNIRKLR